MSTAPAIRNTGLSPTEWDGVHEQVQAALELLALRVRSLCPSMIVRTGLRNEGRVWLLYSYREFNLTQDDTEAEDIVAGMLFSPQGESIRVYADIGGGETGQTDYEAPERIVAANPEDVLVAVRELGEELSKQEEIVVKALSERRIPPDVLRSRQA